MKTGDVITIYQDPITCEKIEDRGKVVKIIKKLSEYNLKGQQLHRVMVRFPDGVFERLAAN